MTTQQSTQNSRIIFELESTYGVDRVDALLAANADISYQDSITNITLTPEVVDLPVARACASFSGTPSERLVVGLGADIEFYVTDAVNPGVSGGEAPRNRGLYQVARLVETITGSTSAKYIPTSGDYKSASIYYYLRNTSDDFWRMTYLLGFRGNLSLTMQEKSHVTGSLNGKCISYPDETYAATASTADYRLWSKPLPFFDANGAPALDKNGDAITYTGTASKDMSRVLNTGNLKFIADGIEIPIRSASLNQNYSLVAQEQSGATPLTSYVDLLRASDARAGGDAQIAETGDGYRKAVELLHNANEVSASFELLGPTTKYEIIIPKLQVVAMAEGENSGWREWTVSYLLSGDYSASPNGDNEYEIRVTAR